MPAFVPGQELAAGYYAEVVRPLIGDRVHQAGLLGWGSDVLGFDTERSTDHGWGPRLVVLVHETDVEPVRHDIDRGLPAAYRGWPTRFGWDDVAPRHHVTVTTLPAWLDDVIGFDASAAVEPVDWLTTPQQLLLEVTSGAVFHDGDGTLTAVRDRLAWYPDEVWMWLLACQWQRINQEEPFVGRAAEVGDELGSRVLVARLARDLMRLCFLLERRYAPYPKWFGSAFGRLDAATDVGPALERALAATDYASREQGFVAALEAVARRHNALGVTEPVEATARLFHGRPFRVIGAPRFVEACMARITDPWLRSLPPVGAVDQFSDSTDVLSASHRVRLLGAIYGEDPDAVRRPLRQHGG